MDRDKQPLMQSQPLIGTGPGETPALSAIICSPNPRPDYLRRCFDALKDQTFPRDGWELVVVGSRSDESVAARVDLSWHPAPRIVREEKLGLTPARLRGICESRGETLIFVDDDNVLDPADLPNGTLVEGSEDLAQCGADAHECD
jgi:glycosyltransferase involved in cell wall biosynthesis